MHYNNCGIVRSLLLTIHDHVEQTTIFMEKQVALLLSQYPELEYKRDNGRVSSALFLDSEFIGRF